MNVQKRTGTQGCMKKNLQAHNSQELSPKGATCALPSATQELAFWY